MLLIERLCNNQIITFKFFEHICIAMHIFIVNILLEIAIVLAVNIIETFLVAAVTK